MDGAVGIPPAVTEETEAVLGGGGRGPAGGRGLREPAAPSPSRRAACAGPATAAPCGRVEVTGRGRVYSYTVNYQRWLPELEVPYVIVLVEFPDHPGVRVMGRLRGGSRGRRHRHGGRDRVRARAGRLRHPELRRGRRGDVTATDRFEDRVVISGVGQSAIGRAGSTARASS